MTKTEELIKQIDELQLVIKKQKQQVKQEQKENERQERLRNKPKTQKQIEIENNIEKFAYIDDTWPEKLERTQKESVANTIHNYELYLTHCDKHKGKIRYNLHTQCKEYDGKPYNDRTMNLLKSDVEQSLHIHSSEKFECALSNVAVINSYNPIHEYLNNLVWDGVPRIETLFTDWFGADNTQLHSEMAKKWLLAAVTRIFEPGTKFDNMIILQGGQGIGKTTFCERLAKGFGAGSNINISKPEQYVPILNRSWIVIIDELDKFGKKEMTDIKTFLSKKDECLRLSYGRNADTFERQNVFIGSTNEETFLRDSTAMTERRFWCVKCKSTDKYNIYENFNDEMVDQIWAEATYIYKKLVENNERIMLDLDPKLYGEFVAQQEEFKSINDDSTVEHIYEILNNMYYLTEKGEFTSYVDFKTQADDTQINEDFSIKRGTKKGYINKIRTRWLTDFLKECRVTEFRSIQYLKTILSKDWDYKISKINGSSQRCWVRKEPLNEMIDTITNIPFINELNECDSALNS